MDTIKCDTTKPMKVIPMDDAQPTHRTYQLMFMGTFEEETGKNVKELKKKMGWLFNPDGTLTRKNPYLRDATNDTYTCPICKQEIRMYDFDTDGNYAGFDDNGEMVCPDCYDPDTMD